MTFTVSDGMKQHEFNEGKIKEFTEIMVSDDMKQHKFKEGKIKELTEISMRDGMKQHEFKEENESIYRDSDEWWHETARI